MKKHLSVASPAEHRPYRTAPRFALASRAKPTAARRLLPVLLLTAVCLAATLHSAPLQQNGGGLSNAEQRAELEQAQRWDHRLQSFRKSKARIELNEQLDQGERAVAIRRLAEASFAADEIRWLEASEQLALARSGGNR
ncbi:MULTISPECIES: lipase secretion chaperone [Pseudomonas]|uniref:lipase secretion chaperone n=1 Tax=Pseudomonas TaxID=286 RepID=UPI00257F3C3F|nr:MULTISPECIES: lipase secretion chaperone [Pseudomonas]